MPLLGLYSFSAGHIVECVVISDDKLNYIHISGKVFIKLKPTITNQIDPFRVHANSTDTCISTFFPFFKGSLFFFFIGAKANVETIRYYIESPKRKKNRKKQKEEIEKNSERIPNVCVN